MIEKIIRFFGKETKVSCDEKCDKAWGRSKRPRDWEGDYRSDEELSLAPIDPGTCEGGDCKPRAFEQRLNKWCVRECERCVMMDYNGDINDSLILPEF